MHIIMANQSYHDRFMQFDWKFKIRQSEQIFQIDLEFDFESVSDDWHSFYTGVSGSRSSRGVVSQSKFRV